MYVAYIITTHTVAGIYEDRDEAEAVCAMVEDDSDGRLHTMVIVK